MSVIHPSVEQFSTSRNPTVRYCFYNSLLLVHILRQTNPVHGLPSYFYVINFNIILPFMPMSFKWYLSFRFPNQNPVYVFLYSLYMPHAPPTSSPFSSSPRQYLVRRTNHETPHYIVSSSLLLHPPCWPQVYSSPPYF